MKNIRVFLLENFQVLEMKFSIYLNRRVFVNIWFLEFEVVVKKCLFGAVLLTVTEISRKCFNLKINKYITKTRLFKY